MTGSLEKVLRAQRDAGRKLLLPYVTGGLAGWQDAIRAAALAGADGVEVGIPFSDPVMDGPVIQQASEMALAAGATPVNVLEELRRLDAGIPVAVMTYYNIVFRAGDDRFARSLADAGVAAAIVPDLPLEEADPLGDAAAAKDLSLVLLAAPTTPPDRLRRIGERTRGFLYFVSITGVTGARAALPADLPARLDAVRAASQAPVAVGFGISAPEQAAALAEHTDAVVVGSALVAEINRSSGKTEGPVALVSSLARAVHAVRAR